MSTPRAGADEFIAWRNRRRARAARHLGFITLLFGGLACVGIVAGGAALGRWDLPLVEDPTGSAAAAASPSYSGPTAPVCGIEGTVPVADPAATELVVLNGKAQEGLAGAVSDELKGRGFVVVDVGNTQLIASKTLVRYPPDQSAQALTLAAHVGTVDVAVDTEKTFITVTLGTDFTALVPPDQASANLLAAALPNCPGVVTAVQPPTAPAVGAEPTS